MTELECQKIFDYIVKREHLTRQKLQLKIKGVQSGYASYLTGLMIVPQWALRNQYEGTAYIIHELAHFVTKKKRKGDWDEAHGTAFKRTENRLLKLFSLKIDRKRAYSKAIYYNGSKVITK